MSTEAHAARAIVRQFGRGLSLTLRREFSVADEATGEATIAVELAADAAAGATEISIVAPTGTGKLPQGLTLTIGAEALQLAGGVDLRRGVATAAALAAPLASSHSAGVAITLGNHAEFTYDAVHLPPESTLFDPNLGQLTSASLWALNSGQVAPEVGDLVVDGERVSKIDPLRFGTELLGWGLHTGGGS